MTVRSLPERPRINLIFYFLCLPSSVAFVFSTMSLLLEYLLPWGPLEDLRLGSNRCVAHWCFRDPRQNARRRRAPQDEEAHVATCRETKSFTFMYGPNIWKITGYKGIPRIWSWRQTYKWTQSSNKQKQQEVRPREKLSLANNHDRKEIEQLRTTMESGLNHK